MKKLENLVYKMLTQSTGTHMCDSGGANGRMWQRNQALTLKDFKTRPECTLELAYWNYNGRNEIERSVTIDVFHYLTKNLSLDEICNKFNRKDVKNWDSEEFYGVSDKGEAFLLENFELDSESFNTYNWSSNFSQVMQGREIEHKETGDKYVVLQIHGGADVRGGYTDAKLFKIECEYFLKEDCLFDGVDYMGEFINHDGQSATEDDFKALALKYNLTNDKPVVIEGSICE